MRRNDPPNQLHRRHQVEPLNLDASLLEPAERSLRFGARWLEAQARLDLAPRLVSIPHALVDEAQSVVCLRARGIALARLVGEIPLQSTHSLGKVLT